MNIGRVEVSRIARAVYANETGNKRIVDESKIFSNLFKKEESVADSYIKPIIEKQYRITVKLEKDTWVNAAQTEWNVKEAIFDTKKMIIEAVFGEFREDLMLLRESILNREQDAALHQLDELEKRMFEEI